MKEEIVIELGNIDTQTLLVDDDVHRHYLKQRTLPNSLSHRQMTSLTALCDTFLPSVAVSDGDHDDDAVNFYRTSASMAGTPERVGFHIYHQFFFSLYIFFNSLTL